MKKLILYITLLIATSVFSQTTLETIFEKQKLINGEVKISISNKNKQKYFIGESNLKDTSRSKIIDLYLKNNKKLDICLIPLYSLNEFDVYIFLPNSLIIEGFNGVKKSKMNVSFPNSIDTFLIYDRINNHLMHISSGMVAGSINFYKKNLMTINFGFDDLISEVIKLDENFKPISSFKTYLNKDNNKTFSYLSNYYLLNGEHKIKNKLIDTKEAFFSIFEISILEIESLLNIKLVNPDNENLACKNLICYPRISSWIFSKTN